MASTTRTGLPPARALEDLGSALGEVLDAHWWQQGTEDLIDVLSALGVIRQRVAQVETQAMVQVLDRKLPAERGMSPVDYLVRAGSEAAPAQPVTQAAATVRLADAETARALEPVVDEVLSAFENTLIGPSKASAILRFHSEAEPISNPQALREYSQAVIEGASDGVGAPRAKRVDPLNRPVDPHEPMRRRGWTDRELGLTLRRARREVRTRAEVEHEEEVGRRGRSLHVLPGANGMTEYRLVVEAEAAAIVDAAVSALSAPQSAEDGTPDPRTPAQRRADALITVVGRGVSAPGKAPRSEKALVIVTIPYADLANDLNGVAETMTGQVLSPATVRRIACDAGIIPAVLGSKGEVVELGHRVRLFILSQRILLWLRDGGCTFPGCTVPAQWCDAHHVVHWLLGGRTDVSNGALLCPRHHTYVHQHELTADVDETGVTWHT